MDILPHQIIRMMQFGLLEEVLASKTIWICASCYTCGTRCPNDVDIAKVMDALRRRSLKSGISPGEKTTPPFHSAFLNSIKSLGRVHELGMVRQYKMKSGGMFKDIKGFINDAKLGWKLFRKGKLRLSSDKIMGMNSIEEIFRKAEQEEETHGARGKRSA